VSIIATQAHHVLLNFGLGTVVSGSLWSERALDPHLMLVRSQLIRFASLSHQLLLLLWLISPQVKMFTSLSENVPASILCPPLFSNFATRAYTRK
jgi:hypothetical protein